MLAFQQFPKNFTCYDFSVPIMLDYAPRLTILLQTFFNQCDSVINTLLEYFTTK